KTIDLKRIVDNAVLEPLSGRTVVFEYSTENEFKYSARKRAQLTLQGAAFDRARAGQSSIVARFRGGGVLDVTKAVQVSRPYPHWNPRRDMAALANELNIENPYRKKKR